MAQRFRPLAGRYADQFIDPFLPGGSDAARRLFFALISAESGWNPTAGSPAGARGLTQLMPGTARGLGVNDILNPSQNLMGGAKYLGQQLRQFGDIRKALAAYNAGPGAVQKYGGIPPYDETQNYVRKIMAQFGQRGNPLAGASNAPTGTPLPAPRAGASTDGQGQSNRAMALLKALMAGGDTEQLIQAATTGGTSPSRTLQGPQSPRAPGTRYTPPPGRGGLGGGLAEAFYDPLGGYDEGNFIGAIGGHSDHVHASLRTPAAALAAIRRAQALGLSVRENPFVDPVDPVHTKGSYHYKTFPGRYKGRQLGSAVDVSGEAAKMAQYYKWLLANLR